MYGIIKNHDGYIDVRSSQGQGTTFFVYLPTSGTAFGEQSMKTEDAKKKETRTILLVDDEDLVRDAGVHLFQSLGYSVLEAANGMEAVAIYKKHSETINLVFLDIVMPGMSGGDTYDRIKEINPNVKVLLSSGYGIDDQAVEILDRGADSFIQKPFSLEDLSQKIREIMGGESAPTAPDA